MLKFASKPSPLKGLKYIVTLILFFSVLISVQAQKKNIQILPSDNISYRDEAKYPGASILIGEVKIAHEGAILTCKKAFFYEKENFFKAIGDVVINQGDTIIQTSDYVDYNADTKLALAWGNVVLKDPQMTLTTDTLEFNRADQVLDYITPGKIVDSTNVLTSNLGTYALNEKKFTARQNVKITNPQDTIYTDKLIYYTELDQAYLNGPSDIYSSGNHIYTEKGFYDSNLKVSHLVKNARIDYDDRIIQGDSIYYNDALDFASATGNIKVTDTINNMVTKGGYAEVYQALDSIFITKKAVAINQLEKDSLYIHGDTLFVTGPSEDRVIRAFHYVKFFSTDLKGICDSLISVEKTGLTKLYYDPVLWAQDYQITGDSIFLSSNLETEKLDSLKIMNNSFMVSRDSAGYNQIRGKFMYGKFRDNELRTMLVNGNAELINYGRDENQDLVGITKKQASKIMFYMVENTITKINFISSPTGKTYPASAFPETEQKLKGFIWRQDEKPLVMEDIFIHGKRVSRAVKTDKVELKQLKANERSLL